MMQNLLLTSFTPLKNKNEITCWENRPFQTVWPENVQQNKKDITKTIKKRKRVRTAFTTQQIEALEKIYSSNKYVSSKERAAIANTLKISDRTVKIWFQNRRMKAKKESYESSCDSTNESGSYESGSYESGSYESGSHESGSTELGSYESGSFESGSHESGSTELGSYESHSASTAPQYQLTITKTEQISYYPDNTYELPTYSNTSELQPTYEGMVSSDSAAHFYNERTVYPTQYYPQDLGFSYGAGHGYDQYTSTENNCWTGSQYPYYSPV